MKNSECDALTQKVRLTCKKYGFYSDGGKTLVGFSGGADSVCMLHVLLRLLGASRIAAIHINHMLRGADADEDEQFCRSVCESFGVPFYAEHVDVPAVSEGTGIEETARKLRYHIFEQYAEQKAFSTVSLAHTASDNLETILFCLCRGAGLDGLSGIPPVRPLGAHSVVRPLIACTREEILSYLSEHKLDFRTDKTNFDTHYTRNFIRHEIVPKLKKINSAAEENAFAASMAVADAASWIHGEAQRFLTENRVKSAEIPYQKLLELPAALLYEIFDCLYRRAGGSTLPRVQAEAVRNLVLSDKKGKCVNLSEGITAVIDGNMLRLLPDEIWKASCKQPEFSIPLREGENLLPSENFLYIGVTPPEKIKNTASFSAHIRLPVKVLQNLYARARHPGERYLSGGITRILKKQMCAAPSAAKRYRPVICYQNNIIWFPGLGAADGIPDGDQTDFFYFETETSERENTYGSTS